ncbi:unnamed protein product [Lasius platythorax]|uniref:Secreted protein n=1 Tax=Lasius platythorax TaxID=488582 RepID=A0AAV2P2G4_9HYME
MLPTGKLHQFSKNSTRYIGTFFSKVVLCSLLSRHVALNRGLMIVFVTLMCCDDCKAQSQQPGLNATAAFGWCLRYAATVTRRNARRMVV